MTQFVDKKLRNSSHALSGVAKEQLGPLLGAYKLWVY